MQKIVKQHNDIRIIYQNKGKGITFSNVTFWVLPNDEIELLENMNLIIKKFEKLLQNKIFSMKEFFKKNYILDFNVKKNFLKQGKRSFIMIDIYTISHDPQNGLNHTINLIDDLVQELYLMMNNNNFIIKKR